ncbi:hypothetical protein E3P98_02294 [Wallemia ichthyophaga]|nr:hypothetical protein E3P98_02294 [Wallemia ichthyophaga]
MDISVRRWDGEIVPALRRRLESESTEITRRMSAHNDSATGPLSQYNGHYGQHEQHSEQYQYHDDQYHQHNLPNLPTPKSKAKVKQSRSRDNFAFVEPLPASLLHEKMPDGTASDDSSEEDALIHSTDAHIKFPQQIRQPGGNVLTKSNIPRMVRPRANTNLTMMHQRHRSDDDEMMEIAKMGHTSYLNENAEGMYGGYERGYDGGYKRGSDGGHEPGHDGKDTQENESTRGEKAINSSQGSRAQGGRSHSSFGMYDSHNKPKKKIKKRMPVKGRASEPYRPQRPPTPETVVDLAPWSVPPSTSTSLPPGKSWDDVVVPTLARKMEMERNRDDIERKADNRVSKDDIELDTIQDHRNSQVTQDESVNELTSQSTRPEDIAEMALPKSETLTPHQKEMSKTPSQDSHGDMAKSMAKSSMQQPTQQPMQPTTKQPTQQSPPLQKNNQPEQREQRVEKKVTNKPKTSKCCFMDHIDQGDMADLSETNGLGLPIRKKRNFKNLQLSVEEKKSIPKEKEKAKGEERLKEDKGDLQQAHSQQSQQPHPMPPPQRKNRPPPLQPASTNTPMYQSPEDDLSERIALLDPTGQKEIRGDELKVLDELGSGNGGTVSKVVHEPSNTTMAKKTILIESQSPIRRQILRELQILHHCHSDYIIEFYGAYLEGPHICMCMEYMDRGSLDRIIRKHGPVSYDVFGQIALSVLRGLTYLYDVHRIIHRDVKPSNILINSKGQIKLCDFGVSGELINSIADTFVGTSTYMSPERIQGAQYTVKSDVWSLGITMIEIALGRFPFADVEEEESEEEGREDDLTLNANSTLSPSNATRPRASSRAGTTIGVTQGVAMKQSVKTHAPKKKTKGVMSILDLLQFIVNEDPPRLTKFGKNAQDFVDKCLIKDVKLRPTPKQLLEQNLIQEALKKEIKLNEIL